MTPPEEWAGRPSDKGAVRRNVLARRRLLDDATQQVAAEALATALAPVLAGAGARVASYVPLPHEPRPPHVPGALLPHLLPDGDLDWLLDGVAQGIDAIADVDLVLVPAVAVDRRGHRLGRGGGSYDRALARTRARTVALLHDGELVDELPVEPHDVAVGWVVTPSAGLVGLQA
jgi:5-formyltetrahydrofolate cyclo-ligase